MLIRLIFLVLLVGGAWWGFQALRGHPLLRVPAAWTAEASRDGTVRSALALRQSMARMLIQGKAAQAVELLADVDGMMERMVEMSSLARTLAQEAEAIGGESAARVRPSLDRLEADVANALGWLTEAHGVLLETAAAETEAAVGRLRHSLGAHGEELRQALEAQQELNATERKARA